MTDSESLILRGIDLVLRSCFQPNDDRARLQHQIQLQADVGPWFADYATVTKPAEDQLEKSY